MRLANLNASLTLRNSLELIAAVQIYMQTVVEKKVPLHFCQLILQQDLLGGWTLIKERGTQGSKGRLQREHHESYADAESAMMRARDALVNKGYRVVFIRGEAIS